MKKLFLTGLLAAGTLPGAHATNYYVASGANAPVAGVDRTTNGQGLSAALPFATIQYAADLTLPGDTVFVRAGTYTRTESWRPPVLDIKRSGTPAKWIVYRNYPGDTQRPLLQFNGWQGINMKGGAYVEINGFRIQGNNRNVTLAAATNQPGSCANPAGSSDPQYNGSGINISEGSGRNYPHHVRVRNNEVFECGGAGIGTGQADYITIENNLVYNNAWYSRYGNSGISMNSSVDYDTAPGYHMVIRNNRVFGNRMFVPWRTDKCMGITDGNGVILDLNNNTNDDATGDVLKPYTGRFLVANNLIVNNGGAGVQVFKTERADLINNTCYRNARSPELNVTASAESYNIRGEVLLNQAVQVLVQNNIFVTDNLSKVNAAGTFPTLTYTHNLHFGGLGTPLAGASTLTADPQFVNATTDWATADFRLKAMSPAIDQGLNSQLSATDLAGNPRVAGPNPDLGAYETPAVLTATAGARPPRGLEAYPNPFAGRVTLRYVTARPGAVRLEVVDALGRRVALLVDEPQPAGAHEVAFTAPTRAAGLYHVLLTTPDGRAQQTLLAER
ncbi:right-handed parallel beta-helix repeat-containing protein [Hymenobacter sp.]|uniref:right-handed parallel beta-helix repeat-containing protein n=1 Tax=Hymenobacter sp. TaxID=1898978 RepID=UPI00286B84EE|nr:right-handed parallel beta-helix repeat-containing protein [Hymenobacter sp.]